MSKKTLIRTTKAALLLTAFVVICAFAKSQDRTVWDGVYTDDQAARGKTAFDANCSGCHMIKDDFGGDTFMNRWKDHTAFDIFDIISTQMPMDRPGELKKEMYADIIGYMFQTNSFPSGSAELAADPDALKQIHIGPKPLQSH